MNIGVLLPRSVEHPSLAKDFYNGIKLFFQQYKIPNITLVHENIGFGGTANEVLEKIESLVVVHNVKTIIGFVDLLILDKIQPYLETNKILLIAVNAGANYPTDFTSTSNYIVHLNAQQSFACWLTGKLAATQPKANCAFVSSYYDCGYSHSTAIYNGLIDNDGAVLYNYINPQTYVTAFDLLPLSAHVKSLAIDNLLCILDTNTANIFLNEVMQYEDLKSLDYFVSPQFLQAKNISTINYSGFTSWHTEIQNEETEFAKNIFAKECEANLSIFFVLGWEAMQVCSFLVQNELVNAAYSFYKTTFNTPRGVLIYDSNTNMFYAPMYKIENKNNFSGLKISNHNALATDWELFTAYITEGAVSGWTNTYLCY